MNRFRAHLLAVALLSAGLLLAAPAQAGTYSKVNQSDWQQGVTGLPTYVNMYVYLPTTLATKPPVIVYTHHCQGSASSSHSSQSALEKIADSSGFIMLYPEATGQNCWDAGSKRSLKHGGGGDTGAIAQQVKYLVSKYNADPHRVYAAGDSSGGIMTEALLGVYLDVFMGGISMMGVPCGCWAEQYNDVTGTGGSAQWSGPCAGGNVTKTAQQWGDLVRSYFPGYTGHRPRLQHWHGATDTTLSYKNVAEDIKEWTNLLELTEAPTGTEQNTPKSGTTHQFWKNSCYTVYETFVLANTGHMVMVDAATIAKYFGLDTKDGEDPETAACGAGAVPGGGGNGGTGGVTGAGGATGAGGGTGTRDGGPGGNDAGRDGQSPGTGGMAETGGSSGSGGRGSMGGRSGNGGAQGTGGSTSTGSGGSQSSGGSSASGGSAASGGSVASGGSSASGGSVGSGGANGQGGSSAGGGATDAASGCSCALGSHAGDARLAGLLMIVLGLLLRRRLRRARP
jgi:acetylxylan esterase